MNKLVSKTPVQRFKEGRKIIFAQGGTYFPTIVNGRTFQYNPYNRTYKGTQSPGQNISYEDIEEAFNKQYEGVSHNSSKVYRKRGSRTTWINSTGNHRVDLTPAKKTASSIIYLNPKVAQPKKVDDKVVERGRQLNRKQVSYVPSNSQKKVEGASQVAISSPKPKYWWIKGFRNRVQGLGLKSRDDVKAIQKKLGVNDDGVWGKDTEEAFINKFKFIPDTSEEIIPMAQIQPVNIDNNVAPNLTNTQYIPNFNWREALNLRYQNPFFAKQGGQLPPRNIIERFRQRINKN